MPKPRPGAWAECQCGRRMRVKGNTTGLCGQCNNRNQASEYTKNWRQRVAQGNPRRFLARYLEDRAVELAADAIITADRMGHNMTEMHQDTEPGAWVGCCDDCGAFVAVDVEESDKAYGLGLEPCPGVVQFHPARRRSMYDMDRALSSGGNEPAQRDPWIDPSAMERQVPMKGWAGE